MTTPDPRAIEKHLAELEPPKRALVERYYARVPGLVPDAEIGLSYAMPCYLYRGKGLMSVMGTRSGVSVIAYSGTAAKQLRANHPDAGLDISEGGGSIRVTLAAPLADELFDELVRLRVAELDARAPTPTDTHRSADP